MNLPFYHNKSRVLIFLFKVIIKALLRGVKDGNDILTLSLGDNSGWTEGMASVVASRIAASGKIVTVAAGNDVRAPPYNSKMVPLTFDLG